MTKKARVQIKTQLSNGRELIADVSDGIAVFTSNDVNLLRQLYELEKQNEKSGRKIITTITKWIDKPKPAITKVYIDRTKEEIVAELKAEIDKAMKKTENED